MLKIITELSPSQQKSFLQGSKPDFVRFLCECVANILKGTVAVNKTYLVAFEPEIRQLCKKTLPNPVRRDILCGKRGLKLIRTIAPAVIRHFTNDSDRLHFNT
jgi:hypothetical protein